MSSISYFAPTFNSRRSIDSLRSPPTDGFKKRKRDQIPSGADPDISTIEDGVPPFPAASTYMTLNHGIASQHETFRQALAEGLPGSSFTQGFPHRSQTSSRSKVKEEIAHELTTLKPALSFARGPNYDIQTNLAGDPGLRQRHLAAMTTTLQRCLLEGDYIRAGRAWGLLLRSEHGGHTMDLRTNNRWGVGAEILLRRDVELARKRKDGRMSNLQETEILDQARSRWFSVEGFEKAKNYYERLVLQYPYRKAAPNAIGPLDFYRAMFGLWIYAVNEQRSAELGSIRKHAERNQHNKRRVGGETESESESDGASVSDMEMELRYSQEREPVRKTTLQRAQEIASRLAELLISPPYTNSDRFKNLQEMVNMWIKDLSADDSPPAGPSESRSDFNEEDDSPTAKDSGS